jgi:Tol biopolymer transport system component
MGVVYLAEDLKHGRQVALKVLRPEVGRSVGSERFLREIRISAQLSHHNILSLIDSGEVDGLVYYVMFYVAGESLRQRLDRESVLPIDGAVLIAQQVAEALDHAHGFGVIHRDVKPENILLEDGHVLVCDFGIARAVGEAGADKLTGTGLMLGTPTYMSPEQATGSDVDQRTDVYSLGSVLYEMLTGAPPFGGATPQAVLARKSVETPSRPSVVRDTIPAHVEQAVLRSLARVPADRFDTPGEFARALDDEAFSTRAAKGRKRGVVKRTLRLGGAGAAVVVGAMALLLFGRSEAPDPLRLSFNRITALPGVEDSPSLSPDGQQVVYAADDGQQRDIYLQDVGGQRTFNLTQDSPADDYSPAFSVDGEFIAFRSSRDGGGLFVMRRTGEAVRRVTDRGHSPTWSPDGTRLDYVQEDVSLSPFNMQERVRGLWIVDIDSGESIELVASDAVLPSWSPNGKWIAYTARGGESHLWMVPAQGGPPVQVTHDVGHDWGPAWSPDGQYLYFTSDRGGSMNLWRVLVDQDRGTPLGSPEPVTTPSGFAAHPSVGGDGSRVVYSSVLTEQNIEIAPFDPETGVLGEPFLLTTGSRKWSSPDPSPDGSMIAFYSLDLPEGDLYVIRRDASGLRQLTSDSAVDRVPRWSPDGTELAYFSNRSGEIQSWSIRADGSGNRRISFGNGAAIGGWSPDGATMAINEFPTGGFLLDTGRSWEEQEVRELPQDSTWGWFVSNDWSADGARLAGMFGYADDGVGYYDLATEEHVQLSDFGQWPVWLPDSRRVLFVSGGNAFYIADSRSGGVDTIYSVVRGVLGPPRLTADGSEMVYSRRSTEGDIWLVTIQ